MGTATLLCGVPQGALLSPMLFSIDMSLFTQLAWSFRLGCHHYPDDSQLYLLLDGQPATTLQHLAEGLEAMVGWLKNRLRLSPTKTEVLWWEKGLQAWRLGFQLLMEHH